MRRALRLASNRMRHAGLVMMCFMPWSVALLAADQVSVHDVPTRPGVTVKVLVIKPERPIATILLFPGGNGRVTFQPDGSTSYRGFPVRNPVLFAQHGFMTAVINAPSDRLPSPAMYFFRDNAAHMEDVRHVIALLRKEANAPVWLVGHSAGSISISNAALRLRDGGPDGIILISTVNGKFYKYSSTLDDIKIEDISIPTLLVHHEQDECEWTLFRNARRLLPRLEKAARAEFLSFKGGGPVAGDACGSLHYHGFPGLEQDVASRIAEWIKAALKL